MSREDVPGACAECSAHSRKYPGCWPCRRSTDTIANSAHETKIDKDALEPAFEALFALENLDRLAGYRELGQLAADFARKLDEARASQVHLRELLADAERRVSEARVAKDDEELWIWSDDDSAATVDELGNLMVVRITGGHFRAIIRDRVTECERQRDDALAEIERLRKRVPYAETEDVERVCATWAHVEEWLKVRGWTTPKPDRFGWLVSCFSPTLMDHDIARVASPDSERVAQAANYLSEFFRGEKCPLDILDEMAAMEVEQ